MQRDVDVVLLPLARVRGPLGAFNFPVEVKRELRLRGERILDWRLGGAATVRVLECTRICGFWSLYVIMKRSDGDGVARARQGSGPAIVIMVN